MFCIFIIFLRTCIDLLRISNRFLPSTQVYLSPVEAFWNPFCQELNAKITTLFTTVVVCIASAGLDRWHDETNAPNLSRHSHMETNLDILTTADYEQVYAWTKSGDEAFERADYSEASWQFYDDALAQVFIRYTWIVARKCKSHEWRAFTRQVIQTHKHTSMKIST